MSKSNTIDIKKVYLFKEDLKLKSPLAFTSKDAIEIYCNYRQMDTPKLETFVSLESLKEAALEVGSTEAWNLIHTIELLLNK